MKRKMKQRIYVSTCSFITFLFFFALAHINPPCKHQHHQQTISG